VPRADGDLIFAVAGWFADSTRLVGVVVPPTNAATRVQPRLAVYSLRDRKFTILQPVFQSTTIQALPDNRTIVTTRGGQLQLTDITSGQVRSGDAVAADVVTVTADGRGIYFVRVDRITNIWMLRQ
jgi:hypothetical protein